MRCVLSVLVAFLAASGYAAKFPKGWTSCKADETINDCLKGAVQHALLELAAGGMPSLGILPLDPLHFEKVDIDQTTGPVNIKLGFSDLDVMGVKNVQVNSVNNDWKTMELITTIPLVVLEGKYQIDGKILLLPIKGEGPCVLKLDNFASVVKLHFEEKTTGSKVYFNIKKMDFDFKSDRVTFQFDNLFNDKALSDNMNKFLNQNWEEIMKELTPNVAATFSAAFKEIGNRLFSKLDKNQIISS